MSGWITEVGQMHKRMLDHPTTQTDILCPQCFDIVRKTELPGPFIAFWCGCYARVFDPSNPERFASLSAGSWSQYILNSSNMKVVGALNQNQPLINPSEMSNYDIWRPACERHRKIGAKCVWLPDNDEQRAVTYGVCLSCYERTQRMEEVQRGAFMDSVADKLAARYRLPTK
jgi:hypothetical protein